MINTETYKQIHKIGDSCSKIKPLLAIKCITYNHEAYIRDAIEGFISQKTNFQFVAIIHDDASTDGTADIILEYATKYPNIIFPIFEKENQYSKRDGSLREIMNAACDITNATYIAICEGDDYWTDPLKLQKQVDFLESNPEYGMSTTLARRFYEEQQIFRNMNISDKLDSTTLLKGNIIYTVTVVIRASILSDYYKSNIINQINNAKMGDYPIWLYVAYKSKIHLLSDYTSTYRILSESSSHGDFEKWLLFMNSATSIKMFYSNLSHILIEEITIEDNLYKLALAIEKNDNALLRQLISFSKQNKYKGSSIKHRIINRLSYKCPVLLYYILKHRYKEEKDPSVLYRLLIKLRSK